MGLNQQMVLTEQGLTSSQTSQRPAGPPRDLSAMEPGMGSAPWRLHGILWPLILRVIWASALSPSSPWPALAAGHSVLSPRSTVIPRYDWRAPIFLTVFAVLIPLRRGLARRNGRELAGLIAVAAAGSAALLGIATLIISAVIVLILFASFGLASAAMS